MRLVNLFIVTFILIAAQPLRAANDQVLRGPIPDWAEVPDPLPVPDQSSGLLFVRYQSSIIHLDDHGQSQYLAYRFKILHPNALQLGNISLSWQPSAGSPTVHFVRVYRGSDVTDVLASTQFEVLRREGQLEAATLTGRLTAILRVPDLRVGDELEVGVTIPGNDPTLADKVAGLLVLVSEPLAGRYILGLNWESGQEPDIHMTPDLSAIAARANRSLFVRLDNPPVVVAPTDAPQRYAWHQRVIEFSDYHDWTEISARFAPIYASASRLDAQSPLRDESRRIAAAYADPLDRAKAALKLVQQEVRYIYVGLDGGNLTPSTADETWRRRYGDCKGKTVLLLGLLRELGIDALPVLVNNSGNDDGLDERLPNPGMFDHVLVRARIGGSTYWLDGTLPPVAEPSRQPVIPYRWVLPLATAGASLEHEQWVPAARPDSVTLAELDARAGFDAPAKLTSTTITRGIEGLQQYVQFSAATDAQLLSAMRQASTGDFFQSIDEAHWRYDVQSQASILTIVGTGTLDWEGNPGQIRYLSLPGGGFNSPSRRIRPSEQDQDAPYVQQTSFPCFVTTVRLPESTAAVGWIYNSGIDQLLFGRAYYRAFDISDGAIRMVSSSRTTMPELDAALVHADNDRIAAFDNSMARITYYPARVRSTLSTHRHVPATYDIDWTADAVPCQAAAAGQ